MTSDAAVEAYEGWGGYGSSKAGPRPAHRAVLAIENPRVRMWSLDPGDLRTRMHQAAPSQGSDISDRPEPDGRWPGSSAGWRITARFERAGSGPPTSRPTGRPPNR